MQNKKIRVGIIFGGRSAEHEVSLKSAKNVYDALDKEKYEPVLIGITKQGAWKTQPAALPTSETPQLQAVLDSPTSELATTSLMPSQTDMSTVDVIFPVLHGPYGEDGTVQGLLKLSGIPFVGSDVLGSAVGMDKDVTKRLLQQAGIPIGAYAVVQKNNRKTIVYADLTKKLGTTLFIKPANLGSSVGVFKVQSEQEFFDALDQAFQYDTKVIIEQALKIREIECSVLGNDDPIASIPGEIIPTHDFYSYEAKYLDPDGAKVKIPADLSEEQVKKVQELSIKTFQTLCCSGMARVDFFLTDAGELLVNEVNTIPGFTNISMYPKLWEATGIPYPELISKLIDLALERHQEVAHLKTSFID